MTIDEFKQSAHQGALKAFLDSPTGVELMRLLEERARPSAESLRQFGGAEDVKLQMSLNFVSLHQNFQTIGFIRGLASPVIRKDPAKKVYDFVPEDASPEMLKSLGIPLPEVKDFRQVPESKPPEPVAT